MQHIDCLMDQGKSASNTAWRGTGWRTTIWFPVRTTIRSSSPRPHWMQVLSICLFSKYWELFQQGLDSRRVRLTDFLHLRRKLWKRRYLLLFLHTSSCIRRLLGHSVTFTFTWISIEMKGLSSSVSGCHSRYKVSKLFNMHKNCFMLVALLWSVSKLISLSQMKS